MERAPSPTKMNEHPTAQGHKSAAAARPLDHEETPLHGPSSGSKEDDVPKEAAAAAEPLPEDTGRERLKRHRTEVAGRVWIPDMWGQEELLKDWIDCSAFDASLVHSGIVSARAALVEEGRRANSGRLRIENRC